MYEDQTFEVIMARMLDWFDDIVDKRPTGLIYNLLAPTAMELADAYAEMEVNANLVLPQDATSVYLEKAVAAQGIYRIEATKSQRLGTFYNDGNGFIDVPIGARFSVADSFYTVLRRQSLGHFVMEAELAGSSGNEPYGVMTPVDYIDGLAKAELGEILREGFEEETDQSLFERFELKLQQPPSTGNRGHYLQIVRAVPGVRNARIFRAWNGPGTAKIVLISPEMRAPSAAVITDAQSKVDEQTPIGAPVITVSGADEVMINVSANLYLQNYDASLPTDDLINQVRAQITIYFKDLATSFIDPSMTSNDGGVVRFAKVGEAILNTTEVIDYDNLRINSGSSNILLAAGQIPIVGVVNFTFEGVTV